MSQNLNYKQFDASFQFQGSHGGEVYNIDPLYYGSQWGGRLADVPADSPLIERNRNQTDAVVQDASYVALRNLTLGYTLDAAL